jgi:hypothetical protein
MRPVKVTQELYFITRRRSAYLRSLLPTQPSIFSKQLDRRVAFVAIELLNSWAGYSRALYLSTCRGALDARLRKLTINQHFATDEEALYFAAKRFNPKLRPWPTRITHRDEPDWLDPNILLILLDDLGASNSLDVGAALSFDWQVFRDLPTVRNFYAHRRENTARKTQQLMITYGLSPVLHPTEFCLAYERGKSQSILLNWVDEMNQVQELAVS